MGDLNPCAQSAITTMTVRVLQSAINATNMVTSPVTVGGHFRKECPRMKNNKGNRGNQAGNDRAPAKVYVVGNAGANPDNVVAAPKLTSRPSTLDHYYDVELADGRIIGLNTVETLIVGFIDRFAHLGYHNIDHAAE
ncbi:hypothetical protein Tco_0229798, partial [Tanacetum coccineum]